MTSAVKLHWVLALLLTAAPAWAKKKPAHATGKSEHTDSKPAVKTVASEVVARYLASIGGPSFTALQTRKASGEVDFTPTGGAPVKAQVEVWWKAPGKAREVWLTQDGKLRRTFDGKSAWVQPVKGKKRRLRAAERAEVSRLAALYQPALIMPLDQLTLEKTETKDGRAMDILKSPNGDFIWFDAKTALPVRIDLVEERPEPERAGEFQPTQVYFDDWKFVGATQLPHTLRRVRPDGETIYRFASVEQNLDAADKLFKKPMWYRR